MIDNDLSIFDLPIVHGHYHAFHDGILVHVSGT